MSVQEVDIYQQSPWSCTPVLRRRARHPPAPDGVRSTPHSSPARDNVSSKQAKINAIKNSISCETPDIIILSQLAISSEGLLNNAIRKKVWPILLKVDVTNIPTKPDEDALHGHRDYEQVLLDVNRSLKRFPPGMEENTRLAMQDQLVDVIMWVLVSHPELHYYQGYHDIVVTFLLVLGEDLTFAVMNKLSKKHLRDFMDPTMDKTTNMLNYLYPLIGQSSPELREFMETAETGTIFALSWLITWFGHVLNDIKYIVRLYDFFIACDPLMPVYLAAAIVLHRKSAILNCEQVMPMIHSLLSKIPDDLPIEDMIHRAGVLFVLYPPHVLTKEADEYSQKAMEEREQFKIAQAARQAAQKKNQYFTCKDGKQSQFVIRVTLWTITAVVSAVVFAVLKSNSDGGLWGYHLHQ